MKFSAALLLFPIASLAQRIDCEYKTPTETINVSFTPDAPKDIPSLPYHITCKSGSLVILNTSYITTGIKSSLHMKNDQAFHLTYTHANPQLITVKHTSPHPRVILEKFVERNEDVDQGFFRKYWMYIVPFLLITFFTAGGMEDDAPATTAAVKA